MSAWSSSPHSSKIEPEERTRPSITSLIVSDDVTLRNALADAIASEGSGTVAIESVDEAVERLASTEFPLIFAPQQLTGMSGSEICRRLRSTENGEAAWIVALPRFEVAAPRQLVGNGFDGMLKAPFDPAEIGLLVAGATRNSRAGERLQRAEHRAERLRHLARDLAHETTVEDIGSTLLTAAIAQLPSSAGAVWLKDGDNGHMQCIATAGLSGDYPLAGSQIFTYFTNDRWLALVRKPLFVNAMSDAPRSFTDVARSEGYAASLTLALFTPSGVLGAMVLYTREQTTPATREIELIETFAASGSLAIDRATTFQQTRMLRSLIEHMPDGVFISDYNGGFVMVNPALEQLTGQTGSSLEKHNLFDLLVDGMAGPGGSEILLAIKRIAENGSALDHQPPPVIQINRMDGSTLQAELYVRSLEVDGKPADGLIQGVLRDVTERERSRRELDALRSTAVTTSTATSLEQVTQAVAGTLKDQIGYRDVTIWMMHRNGTELVARKDSSGVTETNAIGEGAPGRAASTGSTVFLRGAHGPLTIVGQPQDSRICVPILSNAQVVGVVDVIGDPGAPLDDQDVSFLTSLVAQLTTSVERVQLHQELRRRATIDSVTGLENRETFLRRLEEAIAASQENPTSLLIVGVDRFKGINDTYGHLIADDMLKQVAETLKNRVRSPQTIARYTSDQFAILLPGVDRDEAPAVAENLRISVGTQLFMAAEQVEQMTVSVGAATYPVDAGSLDQLLLAASHAMYLAKQAGRNQVYQSNEAFAELAAAHGRIVDLLRQSPKETLALLVRAVDQRTPERAGHSQRVADYAMALARTLGMPDDELAALRIAAVIHDIGMFSLPDSLLRKPAGLSDSERELLYSIPINAHRLLSQVPLPASVLPAVVHQHEHWDGSGYPSGLRGEMIPPGARIIAVADAIDAMTSERAHRQSLTMTEALNALAAQSGKRYDPDVVRAAHSLLGELDTVRDDQPADLESTLVEALAVISEPERVPA